MAFEVEMGLWSGRSAWKICKHWEKSSGMPEKRRVANSDGKENLENLAKILTPRRRLGNQLDNSQKKCPNFYQEQNLQN